MIHYLVLLLIFNNTRLGFRCSSRSSQIVNAFALPGGIVRVTDSLLQNLALTDGELAALLGHEMGHILHRHSQKRAVKNKLLSTIWGAFVYEDNDGYDESFGD